MNNNRTYPRYGTELRVEFEHADGTPGDRAVGIIRDLSLGGARVLTGSEERPGMPLILHIAVGDGKGGDPHRAGGVVLRTGPSAGTDTKLGKYFLAVKFDEPQFELSALLAECKEN